MTKPKRKKSVKIKAWGVLQVNDDGELAPISLSFGLQSLLAEYIPKNKKTKVVPVTITYEI